MLFHKINFRQLALGILAAGHLTLPLALSGQTPFPKDPDFRVGVLPNGLTYYLRHNAEPAQRAELRLAVKTGSAVEEQDQLGLAHFCEHMAFNGSAHFKKQELVDYLEGIGVKFGPHLNAYTSFDETVYMLQVPTDRPELLDKGMLVLEDWATGLMFDSIEVEKERGVVVEEWRLRSGADSRLWQKYLPVLLSGSQYAQRLPIGDPELIKTFPHEAVKRYYRKWYRPDLMAIVIAGDINVDALEGMIKDRLGKLPARPDKVTLPSYPCVPHEDIRAVVATDPDASYTVVQLAWKFATQSEACVEDLPRIYRDRLIGEMLNQRLSLKKNTGESPFMFANFYTGTLIGRSSGHAFQSMGFGPPEGARKGMRLLLEEVERARRHGFTAPEFERAKAKLIAEQERRIAEMAKTTSEAWVRTAVAAYLGNYNIAPYAWRLEQLQATLATTDLAMLNARIQALTPSRNMVIVAYGPKREGSDYPTEAEALAMYREVAASKLAPYTEAADNRPLMATAPKAVAATESTRNEAIGLVDMRFPNGARVILKPTDFESNKIYFGGFSKGGQSTASDKDLPSAIVAFEIQSYAGLGDLDAAALENKLAGKKVDLYSWTDQDYDGLWGSLSRTDLETFMQVLHLSFTAPRMEKAAFASWLEEQKLSRSLNLTPQGIHQDTLEALYYGYHPRAPLQNDALWAKAKLKTAYAFYKSRMASANGFTFFFVGDFDPAAMTKLVETYIGGLPGTPRAAWVDRGIRIPKGQHERTVRAGVDPKASVSIVYSGAIQPEEMLKLKFMSDVLAIMLRENMREDKGGVYGVRVSPDFMPAPVPMYDFSIDFGCDPARVDELLGAMETEIKRLQDEGPSQKNMDKVRETIRRNHETDMRDNPLLLEALTETAKWGQSFERIWDTGKKVEGITNAMVQEAARKYLSGENRLKVILLPVQN